MYSRRFQYSALNRLRRSGAIVLFYCGPVFLMSSCIDLGKAGVPFGNSIKGDELKRRVGESAARGLALSVNLFCTDLSSETQGQCLAGFNDDLLRAMAFTARFTPEQMEIDDNRQYADFQAQGCADAVLINFLLLPATMLRSRERLGVLNEPYLGVLVDGVQFTTYLAAAGCKDQLNATLAPASRRSGESSTEEEDEGGSRSASDRE